MPASSPKAPSRKATAKQSGAQADKGAAQTGTAPQQAVTELKVTGNLMALSAGVFCVFHTPGTMAADPESGLPGVRIGPAPAANGFAGRVQIAGFSEGWLGSSEDAVLIRVSGGPAQIMVTIYQSADSPHDAPKLQVIRLDTEAPPAQEPRPVPEAVSKPATESSVPDKPEISAHIYAVGDVAGQLGEWVGERGSKRWIEGFGLAPESPVTVQDIEYQAVLGRGWLSPWSAGGQFCGSRGMSLPILGLRVRLRGAAAAGFQVALSATFIDGTEASTVGDAEPCEAPSLAALEAFRVQIVPRGAVKPGRTAPIVAKPVTKSHANVGAKQAAKPPAKPVKTKASAAETAVPKPAAKASKRTPATTRRR